jgi:Zinc carboxypeptidase
MLRLPTPTNLLIGLLLASPTFGQQPVVSAKGDNMRIGSASVTGAGSSWNLSLGMADDNGSTSLPSSYRRWWHVEVGNLDPKVATTLQVRITRAGYTDVILPAWSQSKDGGKTFGPWARMPTSSKPGVSGTTHSFGLVVPPGVTDIRMAKYLPYTVGDRDRWLAGLPKHAHLRSIQSLGSTVGNRSIPMLEITNQSVSDNGKARVWIHAGIHPAENTSYWVVEGLVAWLLSGKPEAELALCQLIFDIVPMANPDGVYNGNYRTNSRSVNLETQWTAPYNSSEREIVALRTRIESFMGTSTSPGSNPIQLLLNLHSTHNVAWPLHFQHVANSNFNLATSRSGVIPSVNAKEGRWITAFKARSSFVRLGKTSSSTAGAPSRPFVESMMHDRWSIDSKWTGSPNLLETVMAITFEGTYGLGPDRIRWNNAQDYRQVGMEMGLSIADYFGIQKGSAITSYGLACGGKLGAAIQPGAPSRLWLTADGKAKDPYWILFGTQRLNVGLPFSSCTLLTDPSLLFYAGVFDLQGTGTINFALPNAKILTFRAQHFAMDSSSTNLRLYSSQGIDILYLR